MKKINCAKRSGGQILRQTELFDAAPGRVKNYGIWLRYASRTDTHNMFKEVRDTTLTGAIGKIISEMAGRHRAAAESIQILKTAIIEDKSVRRPHVLQMLSKKVKFPQVRKTPLAPKGERKLLRAGRYTTFAQ